MCVWTTLNVLWLRRAAQWSRMPYLIHSSQFIIKFLAEAHHPLLSGVAERFLLILSWCGCRTSCLDQWLLSPAPHWGNIQPSCTPFPPLMACLMHGYTISPVNEHVSPQLGFAGNSQFLACKLQELDVLYWLISTFSYALRCHVLADIWCVKEKSSKYHIPFSSSRAWAVKKKLEKAAFGRGVARALNSATVLWITTQSNTLSSTRRCSRSNACYKIPCRARLAGLQISRAYK